jgi:hypothetical protein
LFLEKSICIRPDGVYQLEQIDQNMSQFDIVEIHRRDESQTGIV